MAFLKLKTRNSQGHIAEVITHEQALALQAAQKDYANQTKEIQAKLDNIAAIYINKKRVEQDYDLKPHSGLLGGS